MTFNWGRLPATDPGLQPEATSSGLARPNRVRIAASANRDHAQVDVLVEGVAMEFLLIGLLAGVLSGLFGIGGGVVIVPALMLIAKMKPQASVGTSLAALLLPVGALGAWHYYQNGFVSVRIALWIALGLALGAWLGAFIAVKLPPRELQRAFAVFLGVMAVHLWMRA
jgi:uncharacterized membrane protein YfcA